MPFQTGQPGKLEATADRFLSVKCASDLHSSNGCAQWDLGRGKEQRAGHMQRDLTSRTEAGWLWGWQLQRQPLGSTQELLGFISSGSYDRDILINLGVGIDIVPSVLVLATTWADCFC